MAQKIEFFNFIFYLIRFIIQNWTSQVSSTAMFNGAVQL